METETASDTPDNPDGDDGRKVIALVDDDRNILTSVSIALQSIQTGRAP